MNTLPVTGRAERVAEGRRRVAEARQRAVDSAAGGSRWFRPYRAAPARNFALSLWLPLTPLFLSLAPFALLAAPLLMLAPAGRYRRLRSPRAIWALGGVLLSLSGTSVSVDTPAVRIRIRIL